MDLIQAWLIITAGIMLFAAILYAIEAASSSPYDTEGAYRQYAKMFFFAPAWPFWVIVATYLAVKYTFILIVSMWKDMTT